MQQFWTQNQALLTAVVTMLVQAILSAVVRNIPSSTWWLQLLRLVLQSGSNAPVAAEEKKSEGPWFPPGPAAAALFVGLLLSGCSLSLEQARADGIATRTKATPVVAPASRSECDSLDKTQRYWGYAGYATGPVSPLAAGLAAVPGISDKAEGALLATAAVAAAVTVFEFAEKGNFAQQWAAQGCGQ